MRSRLSLAFMVGTTLLAIKTGALSGATPSSITNRFGYSLDHLSAGHLYVVPASDWLVTGSKHWSSMLLLFALFALPLEWMAGTRFLALVFFIGSWCGTIVTSLAVLWLGPRIDWHSMPNLVHEPDIGGSVGAWAAAGALNVLVNGRSRWIVWPVRVSSGLYLGFRLYAQHGSADVAHLIGFCTGAALAAVLICRQMHELGDGLPA